MWEKGNWLLSDFCVSPGNPETQNIPIRRGQMGHLTISTLIVYFITSFKTGTAPKMVGVGGREEAH